MFLPVKPTSEPEFFVCLELLVFAAERRVVFEMGLQVAVPDDATEPLSIKARQYGLV